MMEKKSFEALNDEELDPVTGGAKIEFKKCYYFIVFQSPYEKVGPFDTEDQADAYLMGISGRPYEIIMDTL